MGRRSALGWQTSLADLSLVLFLVVATAASKQGSHGAKAAPSAPAPSAPAPSAPALAVSTLGEPLAVYAATPDAPPLAEWLGGQASDPRQQLTITARYGPEQGEQARAMAEAARLLGEAKAQGRSARVVVEPGAGPARVALAFDTPQTVKLAQGLLE